MMTKPQSATPLYERGSRVLYVDHDGRQQSGEVQRIEAKWPAWGDPGDPPLICYTVSHPSYRNRRIHIGSRDIAGML